MPIAAPAYIQPHLKDCPPGHRFGLYYEGWTDRWTQPNTNPGDLQKTVGTIPGSVVALGDALRHRQHANATRLGEEVFHYAAETDAPLTTGLGLEHPLENGFAFLNPYGLPYLAGSSIKGVLRTAAEALALGLFGERQGWSPLAVWYLFGFEGVSAYLTGRCESEQAPEILVEEAARYQQHYLDWIDAFAAQDQPDPLFTAFLAKLALDDELRDSAEADAPAFLKRLASDEELRKQLHTRGSLAFWDAIPAVADDQITVDILNPHHGEYYRGNQSPHDAGSPIPVFFLTLPPGSHLDFHIHCPAAHALPAPLANWRALIQAALELALDWLGFGAKTSVGYGRMVEDTEAGSRYEALAQRMENWAKRHPVREAPIIAEPVPADLSPEGQQVHAFQQRFRQESAGGRDIGAGPFFAELGELVKQALGQWSRVDAEHLISLITEILKSNIPSNRQKRRLEGYIEQLRQSQ